MSVPERNAVVYAAPGAARQGLRHAMVSEQEDQDYTARKLDHVELIVSKDLWNSRNICVYSRFIGGALEVGR